MKFGNQISRPFRWMGLSLMGIGVALSSGCNVYATFQKCGFKGCPGDAAITAAVYAKLSQHPGADFANSVTVQTFDGVVYLYGRSWDTGLVVILASQTAGVKRVVNSLVPGEAGDGD
jgi:osmotically-inducible protein OsmY